MNLGQAFGPLAQIPFETVFLRLGFAWVLYGVFVRSTINEPSQPRPVGLARWFDLTFLSHPRVIRGTRPVAQLALLLYVVGAGMPIVVSGLAVWMLLRETLRNSQGATHHSRQAIAWVLIAQSAVYVTAVLRDPSILLIVPPEGHASDAWAMFASQQVIVVVYFTSGVIKVQKGAWAWVKAAPNLAVQVAKSAGQQYYTRLANPRFEYAKKTTVMIQAYPNVVRFVMAGGLGLELLSPLMLHGRFANIVGGGLLILFHRMNARVLGLNFKHMEKLLLVFFLGLPFLAATLIQALGLVP